MSEENGCEGTAGCGDDHGTGAGVVHQPTSYVVCARGFATGALADLARRIGRDITVTTYRDLAPVLDSDPPPLPLPTVTPRAATDGRITVEWLMAHRTPAGAWTLAQFRALGVPWPPRRGWVRRITGRYLDPARRAAFEQGVTIRRPWGGR